MTEEREWEVEVHVSTREIYSLTATSEEDAMARWMDGTLVHSEAQGILDIYKATDVTDD